MTLIEREPSGSTDIIPGVEYGTFEKRTIYSEVCNRNKSFNVLLPAGYSCDKMYLVLYILHGYWGSEDSLLDAGNPNYKLREIIGNAIAGGEAGEMIAVFPDIYASPTQDKCDGLNPKNNAFYDNFINMLLGEIMPYIEKNYSVKTDRDSTAITGFSMGGRESLYIGFTRPDLFGYVGAICPAPGLTEDLIKPEEMIFSKESPYILISAGSDDDVVNPWPMDYHNILTENGVMHDWNLVQGGTHGENVIRPHIYNFIRSIFGRE